MDGIHDLGGMQGFGPIEIEADEPLFHHDWESRVFALQAMAGFVVDFNVDQFRRQIERLPPRQYLNSSYYQLWLESVIALLKERDVISDDELDQAQAIDPLPSRYDTNDQGQVGGILEVVLAGGSQAMPDAANAPHRFVTGDRVGTLSHMPIGHNRLPRYARGKTGTVIAECGVFKLADSNAMGQGPDPQMLYTIEFAAGDLWGADAEEGALVCLDLWDAYLTPVE